MDKNIEKIIESNEEDSFYSELENEELEKDSIGIYLEEISMPLLTMEEEKELAKKVQNNDIEARNKLIERNLRLVVSIAKNYIGRGVSYQDLIQEGNIGLMIAVDKFDVNMEYKFSTYAEYWIKQKIMNALYEKSRNIRLPNNVFLKVIKYNNSFNLLRDKLGYNPSIEEMAQELDISINESEELARLQIDTISLSSKDFLFNDTELGEIIPSYDDPEQEAIENYYREQLIEMIRNDKLTKREADIIIDRYGFSDESYKTYNELAEKYNVTMQCIYTQEQRALKKLKNSIFSEGRC